MSGLSKLQRGILRLALTVNMHTQGGVARVKTGAVVPGYRVPTVDFAGPKDLRPPLVMWAVVGAELSGNTHTSYFTHDAASLSRKASTTRAITRLCERGLLVLAPLPDHVPYGDRPKWGYVLTAEGLAAAGTEPMDIPMLAEACELFGITPLQIAARPRREWSDVHKRRWELIESLRNGYREFRPEMSVAVGPTATTVPTENRGNHCEAAP